MKKRDKQRERREVIHALSMILQIGLAMLTCMGISLAIGYYLDQLLGTKIWVIIMLVIGILASMRSLLVLTDNMETTAPKKKKHRRIRRTFMKEAKKTLLRVIGIMWGLAAVVLIVGAILFAIHPFPYFPYVSGEVLGTLVSGLLMWHRFNTLDVELDMAKKNAIRHLRMQASVRSLISLLTLLLSFYFRQYFYPVTVFAGLFATKAAALLYPVIFREKQDLAE